DQRPVPTRRSSDLFAGVEGDYTEETGVDLTRAQMSVHVPDGIELAAAAAKLEETKGVRTVYAMSGGYFGDRPWSQGPERGAELTVADCATLRQVAELPSCADGDVFALRGGEYDTDTASLARP